MIFIGSKRFVLVFFMLIFEYSKSQITFDFITIFQKNQNCPFSDWLTKRVKFIKEGWNKREKSYNKSCLNCRFILFSPSKWDVSVKMRDKDDISPPWVRMHNTDDICPPWVLRSPAGQKWVSKRNGSRLPAQGAQARAVKNLELGGKHSRRFTVLYIFYPCF